MLGKEEGLRKYAAPNRVILMWVVGFFAIEGNPAPHFRKCDGTVSKAERLPGD